jgi:hypothetical protein
MITGAMVSAPAAAPVAGASPRSDAPAARGITVTPIPPNTSKIVKIDASSWRRTLWDLLFLFPFVFLVFMANLPFHSLLQSCYIDNTVTRRFCTQGGTLCHAFRVDIGCRPP